MNLRHFCATVCISGLALILASPLAGQHRGDAMGFQGLDYQNRNGVRATAMGGAYTAVSGNLEAQFWNPAGLLGMEGFQFTASGNSHTRLWRERQDYRPNRQIIGMSFILDGLYSPSPANNGRIDSEVFLSDTTYSVADPAFGLDPYGEDGADWQRELDRSGLSNIAAALPLNLSGTPIVIAAGYSHDLMADDYDRNQTYLDPHIGYDGYGPLPQRVTGAADSIRVNWSDYIRDCSGPLTSINFAVAGGIGKYVQLGLNMTRLSGESEDFLGLNRVGYFDLVEGIQVFRFSYDTLDVSSNGTSDFSATRFDLGAQFHFDNVTFGLTLTPGYDVTRDWSMTTTTRTAKSSSSDQSSGSDVMSVPFAYSVGMSIQPHARFTVAGDIEHRPYSERELDVANAGGFQPDWADQTTVRFGVAYQALDMVALLAGYRHVPQTFIPDGSSDPNRGPFSDAYSLGASISVPYGRLDVAYEYQTLRYFDVYYSNTNWSYQRFSNLLFGYTLTL